MRHSIHVRVVSLLLTLILTIGLLPVSAFAAEAETEENEQPSVTESEVTEEEQTDEADQTDDAVQTEVVEQSGEPKAFSYNGGFDLTMSGCDFYNVITNNTYNLAPGAIEREIVINDVSGNNRNVVHVIEVDLANPTISVMPTYKGLEEGIDFEDTSTHGAQVLTEQAAHVENDLGLNVVGGINTNLRYTNEHPYGVLVWNGVVYSDERSTAGVSTAQTFLSVTKEGKASLHSASEPIPEDAWQAISANFGWIIKDGVNQYPTDDHADSNRAPRTVIGIKEDGTLVLMMNDGRQDPYSDGATMHECAEIMLSLGCVDAVNCDGGGSSTFITEREGSGELTMKSSPSDGSQRATLGGLLVVSSATATGEFDHATIDAQYDYYAPNTTYTFEATGIDASGSPADVPEDIVWGLSDSSFGTIEDGKFVSNGKLGDVDVQLSYNGAVVGSRTIHVVNPTSIAFDAAEKTVPYGQTALLNITALYGVLDVYYDVTSFTLTVEDTVAGTINGYNFTATSDETQNGTTVTAVYNYDDSLEAISVNLKFGKGSEVIFDFEDGDVSDWMGVDKINAWIDEQNKKTDEDGTQYNILYPDKFSNTPGTKNSTVFLATEENGGQVKNGNNSIGVTLDRVYDSDVGGWSYNFMFYTGDTQVWRDVENGKNATRIGMWMYIPEEASGLYARICRTFERTADGKLGTNYDYFSSDYGKISGFKNIPESGWVYVYFDLTGSDYQTSTQYNPDENYAVNNGKAANGDYYPAFIQFFAGATDFDAESFTIYIDDITLDYSDVTEDRDAPTISSAVYSENADHSEELNGQTVTSNKLSFSASIAENTTKSNFSGLDYSTAKIYIDGMDMSKSASFSVSGSKMNLTEVSLIDGEHEIVFEIADNQGNYTKLTKSIIVDGSMDNAVVTIGGHNDNDQTPKAGSIYYVDINTDDASKIQSITTQLKLNTANEFVLDQMTTVDGVNVDYEFDKLNNTVTMTIKNTGVTSKVAGTSTLVSIPVRVWAWDEEKTGVAAATQWSTGYTPIVTIECESLYGEISFVTGAVGEDSVAGFKSGISLATEVNDSIEWHAHSAEAIDDKSADCTHDGYTGRTYCEDCGSVVDWGTTVPATGHVYTDVDNKLTCQCGDTLTSTGLVTVGDNIYYLVSGTIATGWQSTNDGWYYVDPTTKTVVIGEYTIAGLTYTFDETGLLTAGVWTTDANGTKYSYGPGFYTRTWRTIDGYDYYFGTDSYIFTGVRSIKDNRNDSNSPVRWYEFAEDGKLIGAMTSYTGLLEAEGGKFYIKEGVNYYAGLILIDGDYYYARTSGEVVCGRSYGITKTNDLMPAAEYTFDEDGKMINPPAVDPDEPEVKNGIVDEGDKKYYYVDGVRTYAGLIEVDGDYYYVRTSGEVVCGRSYGITKTNDLMPAAEYTFDEDGKMIDPPAVDPDEPEIKNGIVDEGDKKYYYVDGVRTYAGLIEIDGYYYYVRTSGEVVCGKSYGITKTNGLMPASNYTFDEDGKMIIE